MNAKPLLYLSCILAAMLTISTVNAGPHRDGRNRVASRPARTFVGGNRMASWNGQRWNRQRFVTGRHWNGGNWNNWNWHHHRRFRDFVFVDFGFPFWGWGYPYSYDYYPYGCYPSTYPYGYYGGGGYDNGYYGGANAYGNSYNNSYGYNSGSNVTELQRKLADAGYYRGPIDGIMGSRTYYALKAYRHDHGNGRNINGGYSPTLRDKPYSPPAVTTEPPPTE